MRVNRVTPDPYVTMDLNDSYRFKLTPFTLKPQLLDCELLHDDKLKLRFRVSVIELQTLASEGERLIEDKLSDINRQKYGVAVVVYQP